MAEYIDRYILQPSNKYKKLREFAVNGRWHEGKENKWYWADGLTQFGKWNDGGWWLGDNILFQGDNRESDAFVNCLTGDVYTRGKLDQSWLHGKYHTFNHNKERVGLEINTSLPYIAIGADYFAQGENAEQPIWEIYNIWMTTNCSVKTAIVKWANLMGVDLIPDTESN